MMCQNLPWDPDDPGMPHRGHPPHATVSSARGGPLPHRLAALLTILTALSACAARDVGVICVPATDVGEDLVVTFSRTCIASSDTVVRMSCDVDASDGTVELRSSTRIRRPFGSGTDDCNVESTTCTLPGGRGEGGWTVRFGESETPLEAPVKDRVCISSQSGAFVPEPGFEVLDGCDC